MSFKFCSYSADELAACGAAFCQHFQGKAFPQTGGWSRSVFEWFANTRPEGACCCPNEGSSGEFIVDHCHATFPDGMHNVADAEYWRILLSGPCELKLAMESEWGKRSNPATSLNMILFDASKLAALRAATKVMVFGSQRGTDRERITDSLSNLRSRWHDQTPWLWIDVPWNHSDECPITSGMFTD